MSRARTTAITGGVITVLAAGGMVAEGYYYDYTGGAPGDAESWLFWGALFLGLILLGAAGVLAAREDLHRR